jgi:hypothetical protein
MFHQFKITSLGIVVSIYILLVPTSSAEAESYKATYHTKIEMIRVDVDSGRRLTDAEAEKIGIWSDQQKVTAIVGPTALAPWTKQDRKRLRGKRGTPERRLHDAVWARKQCRYGDSRVRTEEILRRGLCPNIKTHELDNDAVSGQCASQVRIAKQKACLRDLCEKVLKLVYRDAPSQLGVDIRFIATGLAVTREEDLCGFFKALSDDPNENQNVPMNVWRYDPK